MSRDPADIARIKIGDAAALVGVKPHVLRYWESEFRMLRPRKTRGAHRLYSLRDVELAQTIHRLIQDEGYTVAGAKAQLALLGKMQRSAGSSTCDDDRVALSVAASPEPPRVVEVRRAAAREVAYRAELLAIRSELTELLEALEGVASHEAQNEPRTATVERVVPSAVTVPRRR